MKESLCLSILILFLFGMTSCSPNQTPPKEQKAQSTAPEPILDDVTYQAAFTELLVSSENWNHLPEGDKVKLIGDVIVLFAERENTAILKTPELYAVRLDEAITTQTFPIQLPLPDLVRLLAIIEYDFYNGQNKDELAQEFLGEQMYQSVKARRGSLGLT